MEAAGHRPQVFHHFRDPIRPMDDCFFSSLLAKIGELSQHLFCSPEKQRRLPFCIFIALTGHEYAAVDLIPRVQVVDITGGCYRFAQPLSQRDNLSVDPFQICLGLDPVAY